MLWGSPPALSSPSRSVGFGYPAVGWGLREEMAKQGGEPGEELPSRAVLVQIPSMTTAVPGEENFLPRLQPLLLRVSLHPC